MSQEVLLAIFGLIGSLSGSILGAVGGAKLLTYRVTQIEERMKDQLSTCSAMDGRVDRLETRQDVMEEQIKGVNRRIYDLEKNEKERK